MSEQRYDVVYTENGVEVRPHFCRAIEVDGNGEIYECYGQNPAHGVSWDEAKAQVIEHYTGLIERWRHTEEADLFITEFNES